MPEYQYHHHVVTEGQPQKTEVNNPALPQRRLVARMSVQIQGEHSRRSLRQRAQAIGEAHPGHNAQRER